MTEKCIKTLKGLRKIEAFKELSLEQLMYEALRANQWDKEELNYIIDYLVEDKEKSASWIKEDPLLANNLLSGSMKVIK